MSTKSAETLIVERLLSTRSGDLRRLFEAALAASAAGGSPPAEALQVAVVGVLSVLLEEMTFICEVGSPKSTRDPVARAALVGPMIAMLEGYRDGVSVQ